MQQFGATNQSKSLKEVEITYYISHYLNLFWRWIWYILVTLPLTISGFFFYLIFFDAIKPPLEATVMIGLESGESKSAVEDIGEYTPQSRLALIKAKGFLWQIVNKTSLRLQVKGYDLNQIFDSVYVDSLAPSGDYKLKISDNVYELYFSSKEFNIKNKLIESGSLIKLNQLSSSGIYCKLSSDFLKNPHNISFSVIRPHKAIEWLYKNITIYDKELTKDRYSTKKDNVVGVSLRGRDYKRITKIINVIADEFVARSLGFKKRKTVEALNVLEKQLQKANEEVVSTQNTLKEFRVKHPNIVLAAELQNSINNMAIMETSIYSTKSSAEEAQRLQNQLSSVSEADQNLVINEALLFLSRQGVVGAAVIQAEFT
ncbi:MAG: hypothetical protein N2053_12845, partial [Chitinispirillaceae bacterium]|nr:hypothetical protein [Chitinispirillaceae bacterium]